MTIPSTTAKMDYTGNGVTSVYSYTFKIFSKNDLKVIKRDTSDLETVLVVDTDYTVSGVGESAGGSITLVAGNLPTGYKLTIRRSRTLTQETDIRNQGDFYPEIHEDAFDDLVMKDQSQQGEIDRALKLPETVTGVNSVLPKPVALKWARWNAAGTALENVDAASLGSIVTVGAGLQLTSGDISVVKPVLVGTAGGTVDAITCTVTPAPAALSNGLRVLVRASGANTSATPTFNLNGLGAKTIVKGSNAALIASDIPGAGAWGEFTYDSTLDKWVLQNPYVNSATLSDLVADFLIDHTSAGKHTFRGCLVRNAVPRTIANASLVPVEWDTEIYDTDGFHSIATNPSRITIPAGITSVHLGAHTVWTSNAVGRRYIQIKKNGSQYNENPVDNRVASDTGDATIWSARSVVAEGDYFELFVYQSSGGNLDLLDGAGFSWFTIEEV